MSPLIQEGEPMLRGNLGSADKQLSKFDVVPSIEGRMIGYQAGGFALFVLIFFALYALFESIFGILSPLGVGVFLLVSIISSALVLIPYLRWADRSVMRQMYENDSERLATASGQYVGVAFSNGVWGYRGDTSWDRGLLSYTKSGLEFTGHAVFFELPYQRIAGLRLHQTKGSASNDIRLFVDWLDWRGRQNTLSFEVRVGDSKKDFEQKTVALAEELLEHWQKGKGEDYRKDIELPFPSHDLNFSVRKGENPILPSERKLALTYAICFFLISGCIVGYIDWVLKYDLDVLFYVCGFISVTIYNESQASQVRKRKAKLTEPGNGSHSEVMAPP